MEKYWLNSKQDNNLINPQLEIKTGSDRQDYLKAFNNPDQIKHNYSLINKNRIDILLKENDLSKIKEQTGNLFADFYNELEFYNTFLQGCLHKVYMQNQGVPGQAKLTYNQIILLIESIDASNYLFEKQIDLFEDSKTIAEKLSGQNKKHYLQLLEAGKLIKQITRKSFMKLYNNKKTDFDQELKAWNLVIYQLGLMSLNDLDFQKKFRVNKEVILRKYPNLIGSTTPD